MLRAGASLGEVSQVLRHRRAGQAGAVSTLKPPRQIPAGGGIPLASHLSYKYMHSAPRLATTSGARTYAPARDSFIQPRRRCSPPLLGRHVHGPSYASPQYAGAASQNLVRWPGRQGAWRVPSLHGEHSAGLGGSSANRSPNGFGFDQESLARGEDHAPRQERSANASGAGSTAWDDAVDSNRVWQTG